MSFARSPQPQRLELIVYQPWFLVGQMAANAATTRRHSSQGRRCLQHLNEEAAADYKIGASRKTFSLAGAASYSHFRHEMDH